MYPTTPTHTEELIQAIEDNSPSVTQLIKEYIDYHQFEVRKMREGLRYYYKENDIKNRVMYKYDNDGIKVKDEDATNNKIASGFHKLLVDQKVAYLVGEPITISSKSDSSIEEVIELLGDEFNDIIPDLATAASNKGKEWLHPYVDENGDFDYIIIDAEEVIAIYDNTKRKNLIAVIRVYRLDDDTIKVELWDDQTVTYYEFVNGVIVLDSSYDNPVQSHFYIGDVGYGWGKVPYIKYANNTKEVSDLLFYKDYIDDYDKQFSDTSNTLHDVQQFLYVIRGYTDTDVSEAVTNFKRKKGVNVDPDGGVDILQGDVPINSVDTFLNRLTKDIFSFGMGVNVDTDKFGNNPTGVALKNLYSLLDMKANVLERKFEKSLRELVWFVCEYLKLPGDKDKLKADIDYKDIQFTFNKSMLANEMELVQMAQMSKGVISDETVLDNHPWVNDRQAEMERIEAKKEKEENSIINLDNNQPTNGDDDE
ncbi:phage portal protein [Virgibacillus salexigens]|uniref:phage portal protein n=1 Tax=Virgibacillus salexigens TaxID=61016 RepID=UPI001909EA7E|nr:phage portal protein [Virgibacillus salexigens]